jgi:hypothetical protein
MFFYAVLSCVGKGFAVDQSRVQRVLPNGQKALVVRINSNLNRPEDLSYVVVWI